MSRKIAFILISMLAVLSLVAACGKSTTPSSSTTTKASSSTTSSTPKATTTAPPTTSVAPKPSQQEQLEAAAKKEGKVVVWMSSSIEEFQKQIGGFTKAYPGIKVDYLSISTRDAAERLTTEAAAGKTSADVVKLGGDILLQLPQQLWTTRTWANAKYYPPDALGAGGSYLLYLAPYLAPIYNTKLVPAAQAPRSWDDIKDPKWKGKAVATTSATSAALSTAALFGQGGQLAWEKSFAFWEEVFKNTQPKIQKGYTAPTQLLGAGEFSLLVFGSGKEAHSQKLNAKMPIELAPVGRITAIPSGLVVPKGAPNPNAAALLADYLTSLEGVVVQADAEMGIPMHSQAQSISGRLLKEQGLEIMWLTKEATAANLKKASDFWAKLLGL